MSRRSTWKPRDKLLEIQEGCRRKRSLKAILSIVCERLECNGSDLRKFTYSFNGHAWKGYIYQKRNSLMGSLFCFWDNKFFIIRGYPKILYSHDTILVDKESHVEEKVDGCYDKLTEVLTENGWKRFKEVRVGELLFTRNLKGEIELQPCQRIVALDYIGKLYHFQMKNLDLMVTPDHWNLVSLVHKPRNSSSWIYGKEERIQAKDMKSKQCLFFTDGLWEGKEEESFTLRNRKLPMDSWLKFLGYWLTDGTKASRKTKDSGYQVTIIQRKSDLKSLFKSVKLLFPQATRYFNKSNQSWIISICDEELWNYLDQFGTKKTRFIPKKLKNLSKRQLNILFNYLLKGDGNKTTKYIRFWTCSDKMRDDFQELALKVGYSASYSGRMKDSQINGRIIEATIPAYCLNVRLKQKRPLWLPHLTNKSKSRTLKEIEYKGTIYCAIVPNHTLYVRRNGKPVWSGNTNLGTWLMPNGQIMGKSVSKDRYFLFKRAGKIQVLTLEELWNKTIQEIKHHPNRYKNPYKLQKNYQMLKIKRTQTLSWDGKTIVWANIKKLIRHPFKGNLFRINQVFGETEVTSDHSIYTEKGITTPQELRNHNLRLLQVIKGLKLPELKTSLPLELMDLIGAFVSEGSMKKRLRIFNKDFSWIKDLKIKGEFCFPNSKWKIYYNKSWNGYELNATFGSGKVYAFFKQFIDRKGDKRKFINGEKQFPDWVLNLPKEYKIRILQSYLKGDGNKEKNRKWSSCSSSLKLTSQLCLLISSIYHLKPSLKYPRYKDFRYYYLRGTKNHTLSKKNAVEEFAYSGFVYDLEIPQYQNFIDLCGLIVLHNTRFVERWDSEGWKGRRWNELFVKTNLLEPLQNLLKEDYQVFGELYGQENIGEFVTYSVPIGFKVFDIVDRRTLGFVSYEKKLELAQHFGLPTVNLFWKGQLTPKEIQRIEFELASFVKEDGMEGCVAKYYSKEDNDEYMCKLKCKEITEKAIEKSCVTIPSSIIGKAIQKAKDNLALFKTKDEFEAFVIEELREEATEELISRSKDKIQRMIHDSFTPLECKDEVFDYIKDLENKGLDVKNRGLIMSSLANKFIGYKPSLLYNIYVQYLLSRGIAI